MRNFDLSRILAMADSLKEKLDSKEDLDLVYSNIAYELFDLIAQIDVILKDRDLEEKDKIKIMKKLTVIKNMIKNYKRSIQ